MNADSVNSWANWVLIASLVVGVVATFLVVTSGNIKEKLLKLELSKAKADSEKAKADAAIASQKAAEANMQAQEIEQQNIKLQTNLSKTQIEVADAKRKQAEAEKALTELDIKAKKVARGVTSTYDFNGAKRETASGRINIIEGEERNIFKQIVALEEEKKFSELAALCEKQILKTPEWLTPYLYLGVAQANMGLMESALSNFEYVIKNAPGDMNYKQASDFIKILNTK